MKKRTTISLLAINLILSMSFTLCPVPLVHAMLVVDPLTHHFITLQTSMQVANFSAEIAKLESIIESGKEVVRIAGDPVKLLDLCGLEDITTSIDDVEETIKDISQPVGAIFKLAEGAKSLESATNQLYSQVKITPKNVVNGFERNLEQYKNIAALENLFKQTNKVRKRDKIIQEKMVSEIRELTIQKPTNNAEREAINAGIESARAIMVASNAEVQKAQSDYLINERARSLQEEKRTMLEREEYELLYEHERQNYTDHALKENIRELQWFKDHAKTIEQEARKAYQ